jgi:hypothetical protein
MAGGERVISAGSVTLAGARLIASPIQIYFDGTDNLRLEGWNARSNYALRITGRFVDDVEGVRALEHTLPLTDTRTRCVVDISMGRGYLTNLVVVAFTPATEPAWPVPPVFTTFARVTVIRGYSGGTMTIGTLLQGYVTMSLGLAWPGSPITHSEDGRGYYRQIHGTTPAAGLTFLESVPLNARWQLLWIAATLTTSATVGNRFVALGMRDVDGNATVFFTQSSAQPASTVRRYKFAPNFPINPAATSVDPLEPFPHDFNLRSTEDFTTTTTGIQPGDQWSSIWFGVREWLETG